MRSSIGRTSTSFTISVVLHAAVALFIGMYMIYTESETVQKWVETKFFEPKQLKKPEKREPIRKPVVKPTVPTETQVVQQVTPTPRVTTAAIVRTTQFKPQTVLEFSNRVVKIEAPVNPNIPRVVSPNQAMPQVTTAADIPVSDAPGALAFSAPVASSAGISGPPVARGIVTGAQVKVAKISRPAGLAMVDHVGAARDTLSDVVDNITLGDVEVPPLPRGEPGGRVIGKGRDIRGVFRFTRVRHNLSDWWADSSSLPALADWLNERTEIKTDMNVEGGAVKLTDANVMKSPMLFMTGHDPALVRSRNLLKGQGGSGGKLDKRLSKTEAENLREYLVDKGGFLFFDDCGVNAPAEAMIKIFLGQMRYVMPEYPIRRVPPDHEVYSSYYEMGGPPVGFNIFWWGTRPPKRNFLEGVIVDDELRVIMCRRDYMCSMETVSLPTRSVHYSPGVYRFLTNIVVYALTHGGVSDHSGYVPEDTLAKEATPTSAPGTVEIKATPRSQ
jgi:hypothetical protein